jgi:hypothetical protein
MAKLRHAGTVIGCMASRSTKGDRRNTQIALGTALWDKLDDVLHAHVLIESLVTRAVETDIDFSQQHTKKADHRPMVELTSELHMKALSRRCRAKCDHESELG